MLFNPIDNFNECLREYIECQFDEDVFAEFYHTETGKIFATCTYIDLYTLFNNHQTIQQFLLQNLEDIEDPASSVFEEYIEYASRSICGYDFRYELINIYSDHYMSNNRVELFNGELDSFTENELNTIKEQCIDIFCFFKWDDCAVIEEDIDKIKYDIIDYLDTQKELITDKNKLLTKCAEKLGIRSSIKVYDIIDGMKDYLDELQTISIKPSDNEDIIRQKCERLFNCMYVNNALISFCQSHRNCDDLFGAICCIHSNFICGKKEGEFIKQICCNTLNKNVSMDLVQYEIITYL